MNEIKSKIIGPIFWFFYIILIILSAFGLYSTGLSNIGSTIFYFVLLGLFLLPLILRFIPSLQSLNIFGVELKFKQELEEAKRHILDLVKKRDGLLKY